MFKKIIAVILSVTLLLAVPSITASAAQTNYKITNPYESVTELLPNTENHYKTNLHTHSSVSDGRVTMPEMLKEYYAQNFDILAMTEHGVIGKEWNQAPTRYWLMRLCTFFNSLADKDDYFLRQFVTLTDEENEAITSGTYGFDADKNFTLKSTKDFSEQSNRTYGRGMNCLTGGAELAAAPALQNHINGFFTDWGECYAGLLVHEGDYEHFVKNIEASGGLSFINHPGHYLNSGSIVENATDENQLFYFADIFNKYKSCLGIETFNGFDTESVNNRIFWDELLQYVIPYGERNIFGFSNSDAHDLGRVDSEFMDFILPEFSQENFRTAMENGTFFATGRLAKKDYELGNNFKAVGAVPQVTSITVDEDTDTITVTAKNAKRIEWIANGDMIENTVTTNGNGELVSVIKLREHSDEITCYVRFQIFGDGGFCYSNPFICDDGNMQRFIIEDNRNIGIVALDKADRLFTQNILGALIKIIRWAIEKKIY